MTNRTAGDILDELARKLRAEAPPITDDLSAVGPIVGRITYRELVGLTIERIKPSAFWNPNNWPAPKLGAKPLTTATVRIAMDEINRMKDDGPLTEDEKIERDFRPPLPEVFIRRGERVLWNGALICIAKRDVLNSDMVLPDDFQWFVTKPSVYEPVTQPGFRKAADANLIEVFVEGEWRRPKPVA